MNKIIPLEIICNVVVNYFKCEPIDIFNGSRKRKILLRRQWFHYLARTLNPEYIVSATDIGEFYYDNNKIKFDHATVLHSVKKINGYIDSYKEFKDLEKYFISEIKLLSIIQDPYIDNEKTEKLIFCVPMKYNSISIPFIKNLQKLCFQNQ